MEAYRNPQLTIHERVTDLISRMTVKEKVGQINQHLYGWKIYKRNEQGEIILTDYFKKHVEWGGGLGALYGLFRADPWSEVSYDNGITPKESSRVVELVQKYIEEHSRLKIPALIVEECPHGHQGLDSVSYPTNIGRGGMFNTERMKEMSEAMAEELAYKGVHLALVSTLDLARDPRWGRTEECFGEDPFLAAKYTEAVVEGFQKGLISNTEDIRHKRVSDLHKAPNQIGVVLKHLIAQGDTLGGHNSGEVNIGTREFYDIYHPLIESTRNAVGVMAAYNDIDGLPCHGNQHLLQHLLRETFRFKGLVMADGGAIDRLQTASFDYVGKAKLALDAGVDLSLWDSSYLSVEEGVTSGRIKEEALDKAVYNVLSVKFLLGLMDESPSTKLQFNYDKAKEKWQEINLESARESIALVKNNENVLPLKDIKSLAVIGPNADHLYNQLGDYTSPQIVDQSSTLLEGLKEIFDETEVSYSKGCAVRNADHAIDEAVTIAKQADVIVVALGGSSARNFGGDFMANGALNTPEENMDSGENIDVASLKLGGQQLRLLKKLEKLNKPVISVMIQGRPYEMSEVLSLSDAVLIGWYPGQQGGRALAEIIAGEYSPNGKLSVSFPVSSGQLPVYYNQKNAMKKDDYFDLNGQPSLAFGEGMSYTNLTYHNISTTQTSYTLKKLKETGVEVSVDLTNEGPYDTKESVLCFIEKIGTPLLSRKRELKGFTKIALRQNETRKVTFTLSYKDFLQLNALNQETVFPCTVRCSIGSETITFTIIQGDD